MSGPTTAKRPTGGVRPLLRQVRVWQILAVLAGVAAVVLASRFVEQPTFIDQITVVNPTRYDIGIDVTDADRDGSVVVGTARRQVTSTFEEIIDQGDVWIFGFGAQGEEGGELRLTRDELEQANWHVEIPATVGHELQQKGAPFPP